MKIKIKNAKIERKKHLVFSLAAIVRNVFNFKWMEHHTIYNNINNSNTL